MISVSVESCHLLSSVVRGLLHISREKTVTGPETTRYTGLIFISVFTFVRLFFDMILSTCPLMPIVGVRKEKRTLFDLRCPARAAPVTGTTLRFTGPVLADSRQ